MRAVVVRRFGPAEDAAVEEASSREPEKDELSVDVDFAAVNYPDLLMMEGRYQVKPPLPFVPGKVVVGRVSTLGGSVETFEHGARVLGFNEFGGYAEQTALPARNCHPVPDALDGPSAAALGLAFQTAHFALQRRAAMRRGQGVLVLGAGGAVGLAAISLAKAFGASTVLAATRGGGKADAIRDAGADAVIDAGGSDIRDRLRAEVLAATDGRGVDIVIDPVGGDLTAAALRCLAWEGRLVSLGFAAGVIPEIRANYLLVKNIAAFGLQWSDYRDRKPDLCRAAQEEIFALAVARKLRPHIDAVVPLAGFHEPLRRLGRGDITGTVVLEVAR